ncbi:MAG: adenine deaminase [Lachnospiraceae bacterium]|nr:adenine deaminase [Lachnospiraceae bacterium]
MEERKRGQIYAASGIKKAELVLKHGIIFNVFTEEMEKGDIAIEQGMIVGIGDYSGEIEVELDERIVCPGFIDGHIHLESSMVSPWEFEQIVLPHGTTTVIADPHEIANVAGQDGIDFMISVTKELDLDVFFMLPSCVPASVLDESGSVLSEKELRKYYQDDQVLGLAEVMDFYGTVGAKAEILRKIADAYQYRSCVDGHAPGLSGKTLNAYIAAGVRSDHECTVFEEAKEKIQRGQWVMVREGTAAHNLEALMPLFQEPYASRTMLVTDDKHPGDLLRLGHIDYIIREAIKRGADPMKAIKMGSFRAAEYFGLKDRGAIAPGYRADLVILSDLKQMQIDCVYKNGKLVAENGKYLKMGKIKRKKDGLEEIKLEGRVKKRVFSSFHMPVLKEKDFYLPITGKRQRVICLTPSELLTKEKEYTPSQVKGCAPGVDVSRDIVKLAVVERHHDSGHIGVGFLGGYGLKQGAVASSIAHDSHNLIIAGINDGDMTVAGNCVRKNQGGLAIAQNGEIIAELPLPIAGLMGILPAERINARLEEMKKILWGMGIAEGIDPFMTLAFVSLPVLPKCRLNTYGVIDVDKQKIVPVFYDEDS